MDAALLTERLKISLFEKSKEDKLSEIMGPQGGGQQGRGRGGGRGGGNQTPSISVIVTGTRNDCAVKVRMRRGNQLLPNRPIHFRLGNDGDFQGPWIMDPANPAQQFEAVTDQYGEWLLPEPYFDFSSAEAKKYSHIVVVYDVNFDGETRVVEQSAALPADVSAGTALKSAPKKNMIVKGEGNITSFTNDYQVTFKVQNSPDMRVELSFNSPFTVKTIDGTILVERTRSQVFEAQPQGWTSLLLEMLEGFEATVTLTHVASGEEVVKKFMAK